MLRKDERRPYPLAAGTADPVEVARFNALADEWHKPDGAFKRVHAFNAARVGHLAARLPVLCGRDPAGLLPLGGLRLLDVGCGAGLVAEAMVRLGAEVTGVDAAERNIQVARRHAASGGLDIAYRQALAEDVDGTFDIVLSLEVVEHVADLTQFLGALGRCVAPGGVLVIGTLNRTLRSFVKAIVGAEYVMRWLPRGTHDWRKFVRPQELEAGLGRHGFSVLERTGVGFNPLTGQWTLGADTSATYLQFHRKA
ncbi:bifunctional 2-polyprenyl-6-hydroxyphenol methylase/3-demethylubiquinol 3-O-methyltransferase UbiG [Zavarzinia sp. CC-PAN008]|uniref:bifunctional 2-polyprenyl-6-hydroxyphenol methylase/3-demethylubiquinol 3-O-methyltransferase UbiG n=1 Tax=Zavarzinia sp. CC-PAN008 TaxID=3243332 RepID=UPI003F743365